MLLEISLIWAIYVYSFLGTAFRHRNACSIIFLIKLILVVALSDSPAHGLRCGEVTLCISSDPVATTLRDSPSENLHAYSFPQHGRCSVPVCRVLILIAYCT